MWLYTQNGFFSIVEDLDPDYLLVRSRVKGDIEKYWPKAVVREHAGTDYRFRASIPRFHVANTLTMVVEGINYPDFKASLKDTERIPWYMRVWSNMADMQDYFERRKDGSK